MLALKNLDTSLSSSSKKTLRNFLLLYAFFILVITSLGVYLYYTSQKEIAHQQRYIALNEYADNLTQKLKDLKQDTTNKLLYPWDEKFKTSLYDKNYKLLYSTKENPAIDLSQMSMTQNMIARYLKNSEEYYLGAQYIIVEMSQDQEDERVLVQKTALYATLFLIFTMVVGYFLLQLLLKPMRDTLFFLDRFIKDTTHELNTPVSTILTNVELLQTREYDTFENKVIRRIEVGAKTLSNIYEDLTYLILKHKLASHDEEVALQSLLQERIEYIKAIASLKSITIVTDFQAPVSLMIDRKKITKVIDNLLSNAVKYNKQNGTIKVTLTPNTLTIEDSGIGIAKEHLKTLFERYTRYNKATGGFGIGLHIVKSILDEYGIVIEVESKEHHFTRFTLRFGV